MVVIFLVTESVCRTLVLARLATARGEGAEVLKKRPTSQATFAGNLVPVKSAPRVEKTLHPVHQPVHQIACAMAAGMRIGLHVVRCAMEQFRHHLHHRLAPWTLLEPDTKGSQGDAEFCGVAAR